MVPKKWCSMDNERKKFDFLLKNGNVRGLNEEERRESEFNL